MEIEQGAKDKSRNSFFGRLGRNQKIVMERETNETSVAGLLVPEGGKQVANAELAFEQSMLMYQNDDKNQLVNVPDNSTPAKSEAEAPNILDVDYSPEKVRDSIKDLGNPDIYQEILLVTPVNHNIPLPELLEVFKQYPQYTFFPVIDDDNRPKGIIREEKLKKFVYSRFGSTLLENPVLKDKLSDFIEPCTIADIHDSNEKILDTYSKSGTTEGVIVAVESRYTGIISLRSLVKLGHEREIELRESHNKILEQKNNDINNILQNMKQGILTILEDGTIHHDYSAYMETVFETGEIEGKNYIDLLFKNSNLGKDRLTQIKSTIESCMGEDVLMFEVNSHLLIEEYQIKFEEGRIKYLELFWNPIVDENETIRRFVINIRDKSEIVKLQEEAARQQKEFKLIAQVFSISNERFEEFVDSTKDSVESSIDLLNAHKEFDTEAIAHVFRNLHTVKGNSRLYGFDDLTEVVHNIEAAVNQVRAQNTPYNPKKLANEIIKIKKTVDGYKQVIQDKLSGFLEKKQQGVFMDDQLFSNLRSTIMDEKFADIHDSIQTIVKSKKILEALDTVPLNKLFQEINSSISPMAEIAGRPRPNFFINNNNIRVTRDITSVMNVVIMHSIRNSLSHGIEDKKTRLKKGKDEKGGIYLMAKMSSENLSLEYWDDGAGLDLKKILNKAREAGLIKVDKPLGARQIAQFIFCPGLSTAGSVTEIAGRGVGMDAIQKSMKSVGGSIDLIFRKTIEKSSTRKPFKFIFRFPADYALVLD